MYCQQPPQKDQNKLLNSPQATIVVCPFITMNIATLVYFESVPSTPSCCRKYF